MDDIRQRLVEDLKTALVRLRQLGGAAAIKELPGTLGDCCPVADEVDGIQANERREIGFATHELLVKRVNRLSAALARMNDGEYGTCLECGEAISPLRLRAMPEVQTCVRCQDALERLSRHADQRRRSGLAVDDDGMPATPRLGSRRALSLPHEEGRDPLR